MCVGIIIVCVYVCVFLVFPSNLYNNGEVWLIKGTNVEEFLEIRLHKGGESKAVFSIRDDHIPWRIPILLKKVHKMIGCPRWGKAFEGNSFL